MLKKKNIAMVMAAATVATTVAPAFAAAIETEVVSDEAKLIADVQKMLDTRYTNSKENGKDTGIAREAYENSVYEITSPQAITGSNPTGVIKSVSDLKALIETNKVTSTPIQLTVVDKGHRDDNGEIVAVETNEFVKYVDNIELHAVNVKNMGTVDTTQTTSATINLTNSAADPIVITTDDYKLDITKPVDKDGNIIAVDSFGNVDTSMINKVVGFKTLETGLVKENGIPAKVVKELEFRNDGVTRINEEASTYIQDGIYTEAGAELVNTLIDANRNLAGTNKTHVVKNGVKYEVTFDQSRDLSSVTAAKDGGYELSIDLAVAKVTARAAVLPTDRNVQIVITSKEQKELVELRDAMTKTNASDHVEAGKGVYTNLAGEDRFETAIEISKESYVGHDEVGNNSTTFNAGSVVLVGEDAIVDGLAAAPLAKQKNAPILLTKKDAVGETTLAEIKRVVKPNATIYLVGGEAVISKEVEAQLIKEMNAQIIRLAGEDRFETSLEIAEAMVATSGYRMQEAFVVGGDGEADAMSIASVASNRVAPIIVTPEAGLTKDAKHFLKVNNTANTITNIDVIGGEAKVSTDVIKDIKEVTNHTAQRIAGDDRHETNAAVITEYFTAASGTPTNVYVAKDGYVGGNGKLIDALSVAPLAGRDNAPIVLATEDLTSKQAETIDTLVDDNQTNKLVKVGNGITTTVMSKLVKLLNL